MNLDYIVELLITYKYLILIPIAIPEWPILAVVAAFLCSIWIMNPVIVFIIIVIWDIIWDSIFYQIAKSHWDSFINKFWKYLHIKEKTILSVERHLQKHFYKTMIFWKITNVPMLSIIIASWLVKVDYLKFITTVFILALPKTLILMLIWYYFWKSYSVIAEYMDVYSQSFIILIFVLILFYILYIYTKKFTLNKYVKR